MSGLRANVVSKASAGGQDEQPWLVKSSNTEVTAGAAKAGPPSAMRTNPARSALPGERRHNIDGDPLNNPIDQTAVVVKKNVSIIVIMFRDCRESRALGQSNPVYLARGAETKAKTAIALSRLSYLV
jgi:hypothetical protein